MNDPSQYLLKYLKSIFQVLIFLLALSPSVKGRSAFHLDGDTIKLGLLITDKNSVAAKQGAELAVIIANRKGGFNGIPFALVVRSMEGPWGTGSKQAVDLIFTEKVWALLGSHDGRNAHLVEQAATKAIVPFVSAWAGDPTLSQAFVPWFFNCVPDDYRQAETLYNEIYLSGKYAGVAILAGSDYDNTLALKNFLKKLKLENKQLPQVINTDDIEGNLDDFNRSIERSGADCILLLCDPVSAFDIYTHIRKTMPDISVFSTHYIFNEDNAAGRKMRQNEHDILITDPGWHDQRFSIFSEEYRKRYGTQPGIAASYAFDGMSLLIEAVRNAGTSDRDAIQNSLEKIVFSGVTGTVSFDERGSRKGPFSVAAVKTYKPVSGKK